MRPAARCLPDPVLALRQCRGHRLAGAGIQPGWCLGPSSYQRRHEGAIGSPRHSPGRARGARRGREGVLPLCGHPHTGGLISGRVYALLTLGGRLSPHAPLVWGKQVPSRVKFFAWLLVRCWINTCDVILRKTIFDLAGAGCPVCSMELVDADHLMFRCPFAREFWRAVGVGEPATNALMGSLQNFDVRSAVGEASPGAFVLLCCWQLWKHRNGVVFRGDTPSLNRLLSCCHDDAVLWRERLCSGDRQHVDVWVHAL